MKKEEFIKKLKEKLSILDEKEIDDIVAEYSGYIEEKVQNGATEEEAIKDFGSMDELTKELLEAYKINVNQNNYEKNWIVKITDTIVLWVDQLIKFFSNKTANEMIKIIFEIIIILILIGLCKIPFCFFEDLGHNIFFVSKHEIGFALYRIWKIIIELIYIAFAIILFVKIFEKRYLKSDETITEEKESPKKEKQEKTSSKKIAKEYQKEKIIVEKAPRKGIIDILSSACLYFIKFIVFWIEFGVGCFILAMGICLGISIFLMIKGVPYYGFYMSILIILLLGILIFIAFFHFLLNHKNNVHFLLSGFIICFVLLGLSLSAASLEIATTEFINEPPAEFSVQSITATFPMKEDFIFLENVEFIEDETHPKDLLINFYYYPEFYRINPEIEEENNKIYFNLNYKSISWNQKMLDTVINDLKNHRVYNYSMIPKITIQTSKDNINQLERNYQKWVQRKNEFIAYGCEEQYIEEGYDALSYYCKKIMDANN